MSDELVLPDIVRAPRFCPYCGASLIPRDLGGLPRLACRDELCGYVFWNNPTPVVAALVQWRGQMVLARNAAWAEKKFGIIAGFLERDESPEAGAMREVKEELDLDCQGWSLIGAYPFPRKNEVIIAYHVEAEGEIHLSEELCEFKLVAPDKLQGWDFGTGLAVRDWLARRGVAGGN